MDCSTVIVRYLKAAGVKRIFGYPGDPSVPFLEAARREDMEFVLATREGTAGLMAEADGQLTGRPGVCMSTLGPGSTNLVNAVANALLDRAPMIAISGQIETRREQLFTHQVVDHNRLFSPVSKWTASIAPHTVGAIMRRALRIAAAERPGPVHITTPADFVAAEASDAEILLPPTAEMTPAPGVFAAPGAAALDRQLAASRKPIILAGISAQRAGAGAAIVALAEQLGCPMIVAPMAKGVVPETHPLFGGTLDMACNDIVWGFLKQADLVLNIGFDAVELIKPWSVSAPVIHVDSVPNTDQIYYAGIEIVGSVPDAVAMLAQSKEATGSSWNEAEIRRHREHLREAYFSGRVHGRLNPTDVVETVRAASGEHALATTDVGSHKLLVGQGWTTHHPRGVLMTNGLSSMGYSLPAAIAAKLHDRRRDVVCFTGDGGLAMVQGELRVASALGLGITVVVFCDNSLNRIELKQMAKQFQSTGTRIEPTDIARLAESMGCAGVMVDSQSALERVLSERRPDMTVPLVIGARIDPQQYAAQF